MNINDLYEKENSQVIYRIIELNYKQNRIAVNDINSKKNCPHWQKLNEFEDMIDANILKLIPEKYPRFIDESALTKVEIDHRNKLMETIRYGREHLWRELLERESRYESYKILSGNFNISIKTIERTMGRFLKRGIFTMIKIGILKKEMKAIEFENGQEHPLLDEPPDTMRLSHDQRKELMDQIMKNASEVANKAAPYDGNLLDDSKEADEVTEKRFQIGVQTMLELKKQYGFPIAKYEKETKRTYIEYADGRREYDIIAKGHWPDT